MLDFFPKMSKTRENVSKLLMRGLVTIRSSMFHDDPDTEIVKRLQAGDSSALWEIWTSHCDSVHRVACKILQDRELAWNETTEIFLGLAEAVPSFAGLSYEKIGLQGAALP